MSEVTYITSGPTPSRRRKPQQGLQLVDRVEGEGFRTTHLIYGLRGVCAALDRLDALNDANL